MSRTLKLWWSLTAVAVVLGVAAIWSDGVAAQADKGPRLVVDRVDARGSEAVVSGSLTGAELSTLKVSLQGRSTSPTALAPLTAAGGRNEVIAVIDNAAGLGNATVQLTKRAIEPLLPSTGATSSLGVVTTGGRVDVRVGPTGSDSAVRSGLEIVRPAGQSLTWDGVARAADLLEDRPAGSVGTVVLFTAAPSSSDGAAASVALSALQRADVRLDVVALERGTDIGALRHMVGLLGGTMRVVGSDEDLDGAFTKVAEELTGRFRMTVPIPENAPGVVPMTLSAGSAAVEVAFTPGAVRTGSLGLAPLGEGGGSSIFSSALVKWFAILLGVGAVVVAVRTTLVMVLPSESNLAGRLEAYQEAPATIEAGADPTEPGGSQATVPIIRRAVELTGEVAERRGLLDKVEVQLERANLPLRAAEAMFFTIAGAGIVGVLAFVLTSNPLTALVAAAVGVAVPIAVLNFLVRQRQKAFVSQLPDMLALLAGTLKAGYSIGQGFESVSKEIDDPMGRELRRVVTESRLGRPLEEALEAAAERMDSDDFEWAVMAIKIQREVGGNLAELLLTVADTMTQRERLRRDVATLTAEGRISAVIIGLLPPGLAGALSVMNPDYIATLFTPGLGYGLIIGALLMMGIGFAWMKKTITIEV